VLKGEVFNKAFQGKMMKKAFFNLAASVAVAFGSVGLLGSPAMATTINFTGAGPQGGGAYTESGLTFDKIRIVDGNCGLDKPCGAFNDNETSVLTLVGGGTFSLTSFWFELLGVGTRGNRNNPPMANVLYVITDLMVSPLMLSVDDYGHNVGQTINLAALTGFTNVNSVTFYTDGGGNVRLDDLEITLPAAVPLPAGGLMLLVGLAGLAALRKQRAV
jgi:hypothetical protein